MLGHVSESLPGYNDLQRQVEHQPLDSLGELEPERTLPPRQEKRKILWEIRSSGTVGILMEFSYIFSLFFVLNESLIFTYIGEGCEV